MRGRRTTNAGGQLVVRCPPSDDATAAPRGRRGFTHSTSRLIGLSSARDGRSHMRMQRLARFRPPCEGPKSESRHGSASVATAEVAHHYPRSVALAHSHVTASRGPCIIYAFLIHDRRRTRTAKRIPAPATPAESPAGHVLDRVDRVDRNACALRQT